jgi:hypothetical protein
VLLQDLERQIKEAELGIVELRRTSEDAMMHELRCFKEVSKMESVARET